MIDQSTNKGRIIAAALRLAAERPWPDVSLRDIAEAAGLSLVDLKTEVASKTEILTAFTRAVDDEVLRRAVKPEAGASARDALFEVVMSRFDALQPYRAALKSIVRAPALDGGLIRSQLAAQHWMLQAAGAGKDGLAGGVRVLGLASVYASVFRVWLDDEDPGLARTMAALDRRLRRGESLLSGLESAVATAGRMACAFRSRRDAPDKPAEPAPSSSGTSV